MNSCEISTKATFNISKIEVIPSKYDKNWNVLFLLECPCGGKECIYFKMDKVENKATIYKSIKKILSPESLHKHLTEEDGWSSTLKEVIDGMPELRKSISAELMKIKLL